MKALFKITTVLLIILTITVSAFSAGAAEIIEESDEQVSMSEGCLSIPGINESVKRPAKVLVNYFDENGQEQERWLEGFEARVFQHEYDHLDGKMFVDRLSPFRKQMIKNKLVAMTKGKFSAHYKCKPNRG